MQGLQLHDTVQRVASRAHRATPPDRSAGSAARQRSRHTRRPVRPAARRYVAQRAVLYHDRVYYTMTMTLMSYSDDHAGTV